MAASLGIKIKSEVGRKTGAKNPVIGGLADQWISYMLPAEEYKKGGYESSVSFYGETLGDVWSTERSRVPVSWPNSCCPIAGLDRRKT